MEGDGISNYIKVWGQVIISLCFCYAIGKSTAKGIPRFLAILPIMCLFLTLPLHLHALHLGGTFAFFITWLADFKLLLFAFGKGPLSDPSFSLKQFVAVASFPIKTYYNPTPPPNRRTTATSSEKSPLKTTTFAVYIIKVVLFRVLLMRCYVYKEYMHPMVLSCLYCVHIYLSLEIIVGIVAAIAQTLLGLSLSHISTSHTSLPPFKTFFFFGVSLQNFWGRRWNLVSTNILRPTVFEPTHHVALHLLGPMWATLSAVFTTFRVSGLMHELIFYYLGRVRPTWEITGFFVSCLLLEASLKKKLAGKSRLPRMVSRPTTVGFVIVAAFWLFFPQLLGCDDGHHRAIQEYAAIGGFVKSTTGTLILVS